MKTMVCRSLVAPALLALLSTFNLQPLTALAQGTAFTYQGQLQNNGSPANGNYNLTFSLYSASNGGSAMAGPVMTNGVAVSNGLFTVTLDFGSGVFKGTAYWLEIGVETNGDSSFTILAPRQQILPTPYAIFANTASNLSGTLPAVQLSGTVPLAQLPGALVTNNETGVTLGNVTVNGNLNLPAPTPNTGIIYAGGNLLLHGDTNQNFFAGMEAGNLTPMGRGGNTGVGIYALQNDTSGYWNEACGAGTLSQNTTGYQNTANGAWALLENTVGNDNTANGQGALLYNTNGNDNTANGAWALQNNTSGSDNTANGAWSLVNNTTGHENTANGIDALNSNTTGSANTANGAWSLISNTTGSCNTANGLNALHNNTTGINNTANGFEALYSNTTGENNTANGYQALPSNISGYENTANGVNSLNSNSSGSDNAANGYSALYSNTSGWDNTADGVQALYYNTTGSYNTANGDSALWFNTTGYGNTANGYFALLANSSGNYNIALGYEAGCIIENGSWNIDIGNNGSPSDNGTVRIGTPGMQTNTFIAGIYGTTVASGVQVYVSATGQLGVLSSSQKYKRDIQPMGDASDELLALKPVTFMYKPGIDPTDTPQFGLVAEQVEKVDPDLVVHDQQHGVYTVRYQAVDAMLLNEFLKQHRTVEKQDTEIQNLKQQNAALQKQLDNLARVVGSLTRN